MSHPLKDGSNKAVLEFYNAISGVGDVITLCD